MLDSNGHQAKAETEGMNCPICKEKVPEHVRECPVCGHDVGYPNVRAAEKPEERAALDQRVREAEAAASAKGAAQVLAQFRAAVRGSQAVLCRPLGVVQTLVGSDNELYPTFYQLVNAGARLPEEGPFDRGRPAVDATLFPHYHAQIRFAALTLDGKGLTSYGDFALLLKEVTIKERATVFEGNSFLFCQRQRVVAGTPPPAGYRAIWQERDRLAAAKLHAAVGPATGPEEFPGILLKAGQQTDEDDFIEVHIYGPLHRRGIERVVGRTPKRKADQVMLADLRKRLRDVGIRLETSS